MIDIDELLERSIQSLEEGASIEKSLEGLPSDAKKLKSLVCLAAALREVKHPELSPAAAQAGLKKILSRAQEADLFHKPSLLKRFAPAFGMLALIFFCMVVFLAGGMVWLNNPGSARTARLTDLYGSVEVALPGQQTVWTPAFEDQQLKSGSKIRTLAQSRVTIQYPDGSLSYLEPETVIVVEQIQRSLWDGIRVQLSQPIGETVHQVVPFRRKSSSFTVQTPSGEAAVRGTLFYVLVGEHSQTLFAVDSGILLARNANVEVKLSAGQGTFILPGQPPEPPAYTFLLSDVLESAQMGLWNVAGVPIRVTAQTNGELAAEPGEAVLVMGRIRSNGEWVADIVRASNDKKVKTFFTGIIEKIEAIEQNGFQYQIFTINGIPILVNDATEMKDEFQEGDTVKVKYTPLLSGQWQALEIELLDEDKTASASKLTGTIYYKEGSVAVTPDTTTAGFRDCTDQRHPQAEKLAQQYQVTYDEIMYWFCQKFGFGEINLAYSLSAQSGMPVAELFSLRRSGWGWGEIKAGTRFTPAITTPGVQTPFPSATLPASPDTKKKGRITATPEPADTLNVLSTATRPAFPAQPTYTAVTDSEKCTHAEPHPTGWKLAERYGVSYAEIMNWFCQGFGFGEIDLAYSISRQNDISVESIFALRQSGLGWGEIKKMFKKP